MLHIRTTQLALIMTSLMTIGTVMAQNDPSGNLQGMPSKDRITQEHRDNRAERRDQFRSNRAERKDQHRNNRAERRDQNSNNRPQLQAQRTSTRVSAGRASRARR